MDDKSSFVLYKFKGNVMQLVSQECFWSLQTTETHSIAADVGLSTTTIKMKTCFCYTVRLRGIVVVLVVIVAEENQPVVTQAEVFINNVSWF